jgi:flagellar biosynthesis/type III secretory pathway protein FliH
MSSASEELFNWGRDEGLKEGRDEGAQQKLLENVHSLMETVGWSAQEALDKLQVPKAEQARYLSML